jgi:Bacterial capsule synthesis protein PGA_cap
VRDSSYAWNTSAQEVVDGMSTALRIAPTGVTEGASVRLAFVGDICLGGGLQNDLLRRGPDFPFVEVRKVYESADLVIGNLECCVFNQPRTDLPANVMVVPESLASGLTESGIDIVSLANNHIVDGGREGLVSTQRFLHKHGIHYFGAGNSREEADKPLIVECKGLRIAFLGACDVPQVCVTDSRPGAAPILAERLRRRVSECRDRADIVVLLLHADLEFTHYPAPSRVRLSRNLIEHGADLIIQHHPHVCQGVEVYRDGLIAYSLGNFVFRVHGNNYFEGKPGTCWGLVLQVDVHVPSMHRRFNYELFPITIGEHNQTVVSADGDREEQLKLLAEFSRGLNNWGLLRRQRMARCLMEAKSSLFGLYYLGRRKGGVVMLRSLYSMLMNPYERRWIYSLLSLGMFG